MGWIAGRHREIGKRYSDHAGLTDKDSDVVEISAVAGQAAGLQFSKRGGGPGNCFILLRDHENGISSGQDGIGTGTKLCPPFRTIVTRTPPSAVVSSSSRFPACLSPI